MQNLLPKHRTNLSGSTAQNITVAAKWPLSRLIGLPTRQLVSPQTKTMILNPDAIPDIYLGQISALLKIYLAFDLPPDQVKAYFGRKYEQFVLLTSEDGAELYGFAGLNILDVEQTQLIYLGAVVVKAGFRGRGKIYRPIFYRALRQKIRQPWKKIYLFGATVNPYAYACIARRINTVLPSPEVPDLPEPVKRIAIKGLQKIYNLDKPEHFDLEKGYVYPAISVQPLEERPVDLSNPTLKFFVDRNPNYKTGVALIFVMPLTMRTLGQGFKALIFKK